MAIIDLKAINMTELRTICGAFNNTGLLPEPIEVRVGVKKETMANAFVKGIETCNDIGKLNDVPDNIYNYYTTIVKPSQPAEQPTAAPAAPVTPAAPAAPAAPATDIADIVSAINGCKNKAQIMDAVTAIAAANGMPEPKLAKSWTMEKLRAEAIAHFTEPVAAPAAPAAQPAQPAPAAPRKPKAPAAPAAPKQTRATTFAQICTTVKGTPVTKQYLQDQMNAIYKGSTKETAFWVSGYTALLLATGHMAKDGENYTYLG